MLRAWDDYPTLSRPISIFDVSEGLDFLILDKGVGTHIIRNLKIGDEIKIYGPYGNGFDENVDEVAMIGGGVGVAPFYYLSKRILAKNKNAKLTLYIGEEEGLELEKAFYDLNIELKVKKGGYITDIVDFKKHSLIYTCGPTIMMQKVVQRCKDLNIESYVSLENRMGCGTGACLSCSVDSKNGRKRACKDGPVFKGSDIYE